MRIVSLIADRDLIERILRHLGLWQQGIRVASGPAPPGDWVIETCLGSSAVAQAEEDDAIND